MLTLKRDFERGIVGLTRRRPRPARTAPSPGSHRRPPDRARRLDDLGHRVAVVAESTRRERRQRLHRRLEHGVDHRPRDRAAGRATPSASLGHASLGAARGFARRSAPTCGRTRRLRAASCWRTLSFTSANGNVCAAGTGHVARSELIGADFDRLGVVLVAGRIAAEHRVEQLGRCRGDPSPRAGASG